MEKLVIDTNLLVAAFFNKNSSSFKLLELVKKGELELLWTDEVKGEAEFILGNIKKSVRKNTHNNKFKLDLDKVFTPEGKVKNPPEVHQVKEDPEDDKFLACAKGGDADLIVSNDSHLLKIKEFEGIPIKNPSFALREIN